MLTSSLTSASVSSSRDFVSYWASAERDVRLQQQTNTSPIRKRANSDIRGIFLAELHQQAAQAASAVAEIVDCHSHAVEDREEKIAHRNFLVVPHVATRIDRASSSSSHEHGKILVI